MTNCIFEPRTDTSSATICKHCGQEKFLHIQLPKQELSDEEIEKGVNNPDNDAYSFREGAKWYRERLKQR
jgi:hypothetical protein